MTAADLCTGSASQPGCGFALDQNRTGSADDIWLGKCPPHRPHHSSLAGHWSARERLQALEAEAVIP